MHTEEFKRLRQVRIVLVEPNHPGNIGAAARAMKNMGQAELLVVNPRRYPDPQADWRAAGALDVLDGARVVPDVATAIEDCHWVVGTSTRMRKIPWPVASPAAVAAQIAERPVDAKVAILFGREDNGLSNEELRLCHCHLQIPADPVYPSLNLAMAVQVVCYELFQLMGDAENVATTVQRGWDRPLATVAQTDAMLDHLEQVLLRRGFLNPENPGQTMTRLSRLFRRVQLDETEVQILRGVYKHLDEAVDSDPEP
ncbi:MAG: RNA methyltransferase [Pseudomonadota bacterium]